MLNVAAGPRYIYDYIIDFFETIIILILQSNGCNSIKDRLWRKNRAVNPGSICMGVDLNRNFPVGFGGTGSSNGPCSESK